MVHKLVSIVNLEIEKTKELENIANTDPLTGINNRRKFDSYIESFDKWAKPVSIIMLDLDYFKKINDVYGHETGDMVLKTIGSIAKKSLRQDDLMIRWGGEEFIIILQNTVLNGAKVVAEKVRTNIQDHTFTGIGYSVTASFGVSQYMENETIKKTIVRADTALYRAKKNGRNRTETGLS